jgi:hypothetical protein
MMAEVRNVEVLTIAVEDVIPNLAETPVTGKVMLDAGGVPARPGEDFTVSGKVITWLQPFTLSVGDKVTADYQYDDGISPNGGDPEDPTNPEQNPWLFNYNKVVAEEDIVPDMIHIPVGDTLVVKVNDVTVVRGTDYTWGGGKTLTWISGTALEVDDVVNFQYRKSL